VLTNPPNTEKMPVLTNLPQFSEILRKKQAKLEKYLLTVDKGCEGLGDPLPLRHGAQVEGQVNPLVRDQHRLEGRLRRGHSLCIQISGVANSFQDNTAQLANKSSQLANKFGPFVKFTFFLSSYKIN
jgi:hypothetical protein